MDTEVRETEDVVIVGSGPAGYTAALYTSRADLDPLVIEGFAWGGLLQQTTDVENYPGYPEGVMGPQMMQDLRDQAARFGTRFITDDATKIDLADEPGGLHTVTVGGSEIKTRAVILAMGAEPKKLGVPGEDELAARGVSYCATCDAASSATTRRSWWAAAIPQWRTRPSWPSSPARCRSCTGATSSAPRPSCSTAPRRWRTSSWSPLRGGALRARRERLARQGRAREHRGRVAQGNPATGAFVAIGHRPNSQLVADQLPSTTRATCSSRGAPPRPGCPGCSPPATSPTASTARRLRRRARAHGGTRRRGLPTRHADRPGGPLGP